MFRLLLASLAIAQILLSAPAYAQQRETPYWASIRADVVNMRVGPSHDYKIDWVYKRKALPVKVIRVMEGWRLIRDPDGAQGWIVARLLSPERTAIVIGKGLAPMREEPQASSELKWNAQPGVVGALGKCESGWCALNVEGREGWIEAERLWGAGEP
ncbi:SH3 domain-containing protein [Altererythrobacter sp.]|uniref:SH3 domain-containing protein n=1 Tax=Altererythrobacter sp. TaxID=1872480 RepID=UPI003CFEC62A